MVPYLVFWEKKGCFIQAPRWSGLRGSNSLPPPWQGGALPDELHPHNGASDRNRTNDTRIFSPLLYRLSYRGEWRPGWGSNPRPLAWQASVLTNWTTRPHGGNNRARTCDPLLVRQMLSQLSYAPTFLPPLSRRLVYYTLLIWFCQYFFKTFFSFFQASLFAFRQVVSELPSRSPRRMLAYIITSFRLCQQFLTNFFVLFN